MLTYLKEFLKEFDYSAADTEAFLRAYDALAAHPEEEARVLAMVDSYRASGTFDNQATLDEMNAISARVGISKHVGQFLLFIALSEPLRAFYREWGIDGQIFHDSMLDLKWKNEECKCVMGECGTFVGSWFRGFYRLTRFALGRLQFEIVNFGHTYEKDGVTLLPDSPVINIHIPRTGTRLTPASVEDAFARASAFFADRVAPGATAFVCHSWLLYPKHREILRPDSNLLAFMDLFDPLDCGTYDNYGDVWRLFDTFYHGDVNALPQDSSLRRAYADWIRRGVPTGWGYGVYLYRK